MDDLIKEAREALDLSHQYDSDNRREAMEDLHFVAGFQWTDAAKTERAGKPIITINRSSQFLRQVSNPIRENMPILKVEPDGEDDEAEAKIANGLLRRIQYNSSASHVYANAVEHMVACGIGWFRVISDYAGDDSFDQELTIKRVFNPLSIYPDPSSLEPDRSDMNWALVSELMPRKAFEQRWPGKRADGLDPPANGASRLVTWGSGDLVRVAEYWRRVPKMVTLAQLKNGNTVEITDQGKSQLKMLQEMGIIVATREVKSYDVQMTMVSGVEQLEETYVCPCKWIPLIPVIGAEIPMDTGTYRHGLIRFQREPQQLHNYFMSVAAETLGMQPKAPFVGTAKQISPYKSLWDNANRKSTPYLLYDHDPQAPGPPQRIAPPPLPAGLIQMAEMLAEDMKATTGIYDASLGNRSNETSGVAIGRRIEQGNNATFHFTDNLEHSLEHLGRVLLDMIPKVYDTERTLRLILDDDSEQAVTVNRPIASFDGQDMVHNDLTQLNFKSVRVVMGPSYASKRQETVETLLQLAQAMPAIATVGADLIVKNLDIDNAEELSDRLKAILPPQVLQVEKGGEPGAPPPPDPMQQMQAEAAQQVLQSQVDQAQAKTEQERAKVAQEAARVHVEAFKVHGAELDNALKEKRLREPPPRPQGANAGRNQPAN